MRNILPKSLFYILVSCKWKLKDNYLLCLLNFLSLYIYLPKSNVLDLARCQVLLFFPLVLVYYFLLFSSQQLSIANSSSVGHRTSWPLPVFFSMLKLCMTWACAGLVHGVTTFVNVSTYICANALLFQENMAFLFATSRF